MHGELLPMKSLARSKKGSSLVLGVVLLVLVTLVGGIFFYNSVMGSINFSTNAFNTQMKTLLLESANINSTHIVAFLKNVSTKVLDITTAFVNQAPAMLRQALQIAPAALGMASIGGYYSKGTTYTVKLSGLFGVLLAFDVTF